MEQLVFHSATMFPQLPSIFCLQEFWRLVYGNTRDFKKRRCDLGRNRCKQSADCKSEAALARHRDEFVSSNSGCQPMSSENPMIVVTPEVGKDGWTQGHQQEAEFQRLKRTTALFEGVESGSMPKSSLSRRMKKGFRYWKQYQELVTQSYISRKKRDAKAAELPSLHGKKVFIATASCKDRAFIQTLQEIGVAKIDMDTPIGADLCVVDDTADLPVTVQWSLIIGGGFNQIYNVGLGDC